MTLGEFRQLTASLPAGAELRTVDDLPVIIIIDNNEGTIWVSDNEED